MSSHVAVFLPSLAGGGAERAMVNLVTGLSDRGISVDLVLAKAEGPYLKLVPAGVRVIDLGAPRMLLALRSLVTYIRSERPSVLLSALDHASIVAIAAARLSRTPLRVLVSVQSTVDRAGLQLRLISRLLGALHRGAHAFLAVSDGVADDIVRTARIPRNRVEVLYNPVITRAMKPLAAEKPAHPWFGDPSLHIVLGVGRLASQKNFRVLIEAFSHAGTGPKAKLVILGEGPERTALEALIKERDLGDRVALPGFVENPYPCMARADVFVLSSDYEGLPTVLIESLALGTPVISTDCPSGPREILRGGVLGELVPVGDVQALSAAIGRVLTLRPMPPPPETLEPYTVDAVVGRFAALSGLCA